MQYDTLCMFVFVWCLITLELDFIYLCFSTLHLSYSAVYNKFGRSFVVLFPYLFLYKDCFVFHETLDTHIVRVYVSLVLQYSLPMPKGGRQGVLQNPILREDQLPKKMLHPKKKKSPLPVSCFF